MGAPGVSVGLMYLPEIYETPEELGEILKPLGNKGAFIAVSVNVHKSRRHSQAHGLNFHVRLFFFGQGCQPS